MPKRVLIVTDAFDGKLFEAPVAEALAAGWLESARDDAVTGLTMNDGGPGFLHAAHRALGGELASIAVAGPWGTPETHGILTARDRVGRSTIIAELSRQCPPEYPGGPGAQADAALATTSAYVGALIERITERGADRIVLGLSESPALDGGAGMLGRLLGHILGPTETLVQALATSGGLGLEELARQDLRAIDRLCEKWRNSHVEVATSRASPLLGLAGLAATRGPEMGLNPEQSQQLERAMGAWADAAIRAVAPGFSERSGNLLERDLGERRRQLVTEPGLAGGGGTAFALRLIGARALTGAQLMADFLGLDAQVAASDLVLIAQPELNELTLVSPVLDEVTRSCLVHAIPVVTLSGVKRVNRRGLAGLGIVGSYDLESMGAGLSGDRHAQLNQLGVAAARVARTWSR